MDSSNLDSRRLRKRRAHLETHLVQGTTPGLLVVSNSQTKTTDFELMQDPWRKCMAKRIGSVFAHGYVCGFVKRGGIEVLTHCQVGDPDKGSQTDSDLNRMT